ncbi:hypothetical protein AAHC03_026604 [Spirometra sp. Aus1]
MWPGNADTGRRTGGPGELQNTGCCCQIRCRSEQKADFAVAIRMGVPGLWKLLEAARRKADLEQFRGMKIAIDMNIWLHQAVKSRGAQGTSNPNFYLSILFRRICKLLFFGIRPVFVFDGAVPDLKKATLAVRRASRRNLQTKSDLARRRLLNRILRRMAKAETDRKSTKDLSAELLQRLKSGEDARRAEIDQAMFGLSSSEYFLPRSGAIKALEEEQESAANLAHDFLDGLPSFEDIDLESEAFAALPTSAQVHVLLILQRHLTSRNAACQKVIEAENESSTSNAFSAFQLNRLMLRRKLTIKQAQIKQRLDEKALHEVVSSLDGRTADLVGVYFARDLDSGVQVQAARIVSQDQGHAIRLKKTSSSKPSAVSALERLKRLITPPRSESSSDIEVTSDSVPVDTEHRINSAREGSPSEEPVELQFSFRSREDVSVDSEHHPKSPSSSSEAVYQVTAPIGAVKERSPIPEFFAEVMPHAVHKSNSSSLKLNAGVDSTSETVSRKSQHLLVPAGNVPQVDLTSGDRISEPETSSSEEDEIDFIDVDEVATSSSPPNTTILLNSPQECPSNRDLQDTESDDSEYDLEEVAVTDEEEVTVNSQNVTNVSKTSSSEILVGSGAEDDFELDDDFLRAEADRLERLAQQTSNDVIAEAQRLLLLFGLPFIVSPEEAEAQCCRLQQLGLVDIVASDDSDVWLFGARLVLRHLFGTPRGSFTASYAVEDIHRRLGLDRAQLLRIALLCGSDYTTGVPKIGTVKAMEILAEFAGKPSELPSGCISELTLKRHVNSVVEPLANFRTTVMNAEQMPSLSSKSSPSKSRWRCISLPNDFPNATVVEAYLSPNVDSSTSNFLWTEPQVSGLVKFAVERLGWSTATSESTLSSVFEKFNNSAHDAKQATLITDFFPRSPLKSKEPDELLSSKRTARLAVSSQKLRYAAEFSDILSKDDGTWLKIPSVSSTKPPTPECSVSTVNGSEICPNRRRRLHPERGVSKGSQRKRRRKQF